MLVTFVSALTVEYVLRLIFGRSASGNPSPYLVSVQNIQRGYDKSFVKSHTRDSKTIVGDAADLQQERAQSA